MALHIDPGLQPERTVLAWGRTLVALLTASAIFLRWLPTHGLFVFALVATAAVTAASIFATQRIRYRRHAQGMNTEQLRADLAGVFSLSAAVLLLGAFSMVALQTL
ncbi:MAG: DUF202 domain-containing protein [Arthrobacter sp.]|nr:DUF202 domain-containing protein [Arthrobacter sp.]MDZ4351423.1 DUF202 domain-containing protein [Arthrobacter sp.]